MRRCFEINYLLSIEKLIFSLVILDVRLLKDQLSKTISSLHPLIKIKQTINFNS